MYVLIRAYLFAPAWPALRGKKKRGKKIAAASGPRGHEEFLERLLACALKAHRAKMALYLPVYSKARGFGLFALRDIEQGEVVQVEP